MHTTDTAPVREPFAHGRSDLPVPTTGMVATHFVVASDIDTTARFYSEVLGGEVVWRAVHPGRPRT
jgi:hypothetical protein